MQTRYERKIVVGQTFSVPECPNPNSERLAQNFYLKSYAYRIRNNKLRWSSIGLGTLVPTPRLCIVGLMDASQSMH